MSLQDILTELKDLPASLEKNARYAAVAELIAAEEKRRLLGVGDLAPAFSLTGPKFGRVSSAELLRQGPVIVNFYRGLWCSYCQRDLAELEEMMTRIRSVESSVLAIAHNIGSRMHSGIREDIDVSFPILDDKDGRVAEQFGLRWSPEEAQIIEAELGMNIVTLRDTGPWIFPMQARYVIDQHGIIAFAEVVYNWDTRSKLVGMLPILAALGQPRHS
jgi:peroxiredoxin